MLISIPSFALVAEDASCTTASGLEITIIDNQGIGPVRKSRPVAIVHDSRDNEEVVASFSVMFKGDLAHPAPGQWVDSRTAGQKFELAASAARTQFAVRVVLTSGPRSGQVVNEAANCSVFNAF
jgi:hypothetical protein